MHMGGAEVTLTDPPGRCSCAHAGGQIARPPVQREVAACDRAGSGQPVLDSGEPVSRYGAATGRDTDRAGIGLLTGFPDAIPAGARVLLACVTS